MNEEEKEAIRQQIETYKKQRMEAKASHDDAAARYYKRRLNDLMFGLYIKLARDIK